jgi:hypothetical protein
LAARRSRRWQRRRPRSPLHWKGSNTAWRFWVHEDLKGQTRVLHEELKAQILMLHEDTIARFALVGEGPRRARPPKGRRKRR